jgi:FOG: Ankyrin repeat
LNYAAEDNRAKVVETLLFDGRADPNQQDNSGLNPLGYAAEGGSTKMIKSLLSDGRVDSDRQNRYGRTPLSQACSEEPH